MFGIPVTGYVIVLCKEDDMLTVIGVLAVIALIVGVAAIVVVLKNIAPVNRTPAIRITQDEVQAGLLEQQLVALRERNARLVHRHEVLAEIEVELGYRADLEHGIADVLAAIRTSRPTRSAPVPSSAAPPSAAPPSAPPAAT